MRKRVIITLLATCMIAGLPRSPVEGAQEVDEDEAKRLVDAGMAELADIEVADEDDGDGLDKRTVTQLKVIATNEKVEIASGANKDAMLEAIRNHRDRVAARQTLDDADRAKLAEIAKTEGVEFTDATDDAALRDAIFAKAFPASG
jgi:hypothetical protein